MYIMHVLLVALDSVLIIMVQLVEPGFLTN